MYQKVLLKAKRYTYVIAGLPPFLFLVLLLNRYGVNVPYADHWALVPLFQKIDSGTLSVHDLWAQHNEHRIVFPRIIALLIARLTHWYTPAEIVFSLLMGLIGLFIIAMLLNNTVRKKLIIIPSFILMSAWFFSPIQWENWLWGWQIEWFMCVTAVLATIYGLLKFLQNKKYPYFLLALASATFATFSLGSGILVWIVGLGMLIVLYKQLSDKKPIIIWTVAALFETALYYYHYKKPPYHPSMTIALHYPGRFFEYYVTTFGRPFSDNPKVAYLMGALLLTTLLAVSVIALRLRKKLSLIAIVPWYAIVAYGLIAVGGTAASRLGFGIPSAMSSRYTAFTPIFIIGLIGILGVLFDLYKKPQHLFMQQNFVIILIIINIPLLLFSYVIGTHEMKQQSALFVYIKQCTSQPIMTDECVLRTYPPSAEVGRERLEYAKQHHYGGY